MRPLLHPFALGGVPLLGKGVLTPNPDLAGYWPLAKSGAVDLADYSGRAHALTASASSPTQTTGPSNNLPYAAAFASASSQYFTAASLALPRTVFTVALWVKPSGVTGTQNFAAWGGTGGGSAGWILRRSGAAPLFLASLDGSTFAAAPQSVATLTDGAWALLFASCDGVNASVEIYGQTPVTAAFAGPIAQTSATLAVGTTASLSGDFNGAASHLIICPFKLTAADKAYLWNNGNGRALT